MACPHVNSTTARAPPNATTPVHKEECTYCFDNWDLPDGVFVCLSCYNGGCAKHGALHANKRKHSIALNIKRVPKPVPKEDESKPASEPPHKITKLAIGLPGGVPMEGAEDTFDYPSYAFCFACNKQIDKNDPSLAKAVEAVQKATSASKQDDFKSWELKVIQCEHTVTLQQDPNAPKLASKALSHCNECELNSALWLCLTCGHLGCSRKYFDGSGGNGHAEDHYKSSKHPVVCKMGTITPEGADLFCYRCDEQRLDPELAQHLSRFGINIATQTKTEKSTSELSLEYNLAYDTTFFSQTKEEGAVMKNLFGPGYTGLRNLGNTCYMASILQTAFALPEFQARYYPLVKEHQQTCQSSPTECYLCQMAKLADGLLSGRYSKQPDNQGSKDEKSKEEEQPGIPPRMLKTLICKEHAEFSTMAQQDAYEFFQFFLKSVQQRERANGVDPTATFSFSLQQRLQCMGCKRVRYSSVKQTEVSLPIPMEAANPPVLPIEGEKPEDKIKREAQSKVPLTACFDSFIADEQLEFHCPNCNKNLPAKKSYRFETFPETLALHIRRFVYEDWVPRKLAVQLDVSDKLDLSKARTSADRGAEVLLPENDQNSVAPAINQQFVQSLMDMGFPKVRAERAVFCTNNAGPEVAMAWLLDHMEDADIDTPIPKPAASSASSQKPVNEESVRQLQDMGFTAAQARKALRETDHDPGRAVEWLFSHPDETGADEPPQKKEVESVVVDMLPAVYELIGFVVHLGPSVHTGHYVAFIKKNGQWAQFNDRKVAESTNPPSGQAYMYFFRRIKS